MRARNAGYSYAPPSPPGLLELRRQLPGGGRWAPLEAIGPIGVLKELDTICAAMAGGHAGPDRGNRVSLVADLGRSFAALGPKTQQAAAPTLKQFTGSLSKLAGELESPQGVRRVQLSCSSVREVLCSEPVVRAAFHDAADVFQDVGASGERCEQMVLIVYELARARGVDWRQRLPSVEAALEDDARFLSRPIFAHLGVAKPPADAPSGTPHYAGLSAQQRVDLAAELLPKAASTSQVLLWFVIGDAAVRDGYLRAGPIELFDAASVPQALEPGGILSQTVPDFVSPPEFGELDRVTRQITRLESLHGASEKLLARVQIEDAPVAQARERARATLEGLIELADPDSPWVLYSGDCTWRPGEGWSGTTYSRPDDDEPGHGDVTQEPTARRLGDLDAGLVSRLLSGEHAAQERFDEALWMTAIYRAPTASQRVVLSVRLVERALAQVIDAGHGWVDAARDYLRAPWIAEELRLRLFDAAASAFHTWVMGYLEPWQRARREEVFPRKDGDADVRGFDLAAFARHAEEAVRRLPEGDMEQRIVRTQHKLLASPQGALAELGDLDKRFRALLERTARVRNAIVHGSGVSDETLATVDRFSTELARLASEQLLHQAADDDASLARLQRRRVEHAQATERLRAGEEPFGVLFAS